MDHQIFYKDLYMVCTRLNESALTDLPDEYYVRNCEKNELEIWKAMPFPNEESAKSNYNNINNWYNRACENKTGLFLEKCKFLCNKNDEPIGTCLAWRLFDKINTIQWFKIKYEYEGKGLGRALLSIIMKNEVDYPIYLHVQPCSYRAISLYSDFGFKFISEKMIGNCSNDLNECLPYLKEFMGAERYDNLKVINGDTLFLKIISNEDITYL